MLSHIRLRLETRNTVGKSYKVQVRAKNAAGFGKWSKAVKVTIKK